MDASLIGPQGAHLSRISNRAGLRTLLLHNPKAGTGTPDAATLRAALGQAGCDVVHYSKEDGDVDEALAADWDLVAVAGGDGTVGKTARTLRDRNTPVAILPMGTANNVARSLGLTAPAEELAALLNGAPARPLDIGFAEGPWGRRGFVEAVGLGAVAEAILKADRGGAKPPFEERIRKGRKGLRKTIEKAKPYPFSLRIDGNEIDGEFLFIEVLNLCFSGPRLPFAHRAEAGDGLLDVLFLGEDNRKAVIEWIAEAPELEPPPLQLIRGRKVEILWKDAPLRIDDKVYSPKKRGSSVEIGLNDQSLSVLCPDPSNLTQ